MSTRHRVDMPTPGMPKRFERLRFFSAPADGETVAPAPGPPASPAAPETPEASEVPAQETDWKAEARKWETRAKENKTAAEKLAEIEEASKTEAQKNADALAAAQARVKEFETREQIAAWKAEVSKETGVPATALAGSTLEELQAHAEVLKPLITKSAEPSDDGKPHVPYRELSRVVADAPAPSPGVGTLRAAYADQPK
ncbi:hypothetical protein GCM10025865_01150 [Paraoerskovia sediminicola]|uniref:Uncharacterized protein n=1 Tax=Paraoerskovia sediminicola TaxID=1138587 RepID=A0ABN6XBA0_9CELL|nr:hypothetical protein [Paraoerskovia sediminicola]BDZ40816.1 hypothetical protein GCM10025865_01150 [Paraoerskovia sediminicola]